jgi:hypothetical protein
MTVIILTAVVLTGLIAETIVMVYNDHPSFRCLPRSHHGDVFENHTLI